MGHPAAERPAPAESLHWLNDEGVACDLYRQRRIEFPPRPAGASWEATAQPGQQVIERLGAAPFAGGGSARLQWDRGRGLGHILGWLDQQQSATWQDRWIASRAGEHGNSAWRHLPAAWLAAAGRVSVTPPAPRSCSGAPCWRWSAAM